MHGLRLGVYSSFNTVSYNIISYNKKYGISIHSSSEYNIIHDNSFSNNGFGDVTPKMLGYINTRYDIYSAIIVDNSSNNSLYKNDFLGNNYGIYSYNLSNNNTIYHNNFLINNHSAYDDGFN